MIAQFDLEAGIEPQIRREVNFKGDYFEEVGIRDAPSEPCGGIGGIILL